MANNDGKPTLLVVEDDAALCRLVVRFLKGAGFATLAAGTAVEGLSLVRKHQGAIDLAIIDMVMPGVSGLDLATDLDREYPELKILYISGFVDSVAADVLSRRTPDRVLLKPFSERALLDRVDQLLGNTSQRKPATLSEPTAPTLRNGTLG